MRYIKRLCIPLSLLIVCGCTAKTPKRQHVLYFDQDIKIQYKSNVNTCDYIATVDSYEIQASMIDDDTVYVSNFEVKCPKIDTNHLGETILTYKIGNDTYKTKAMITDKTKPVISAKNELAFTIGDRHEAVRSYFKVSDPIDPVEDITITLLGKINWQKAGSYKVTAIAKDKSGNESRKTITFILKEKPKKEESKSASENGQEESKPKASVSEKKEKKESDGDTGGEKINEKVDKPVISNKDYLFSDGFDMDSAASVCQADLLSSGKGGSCIPLKNAEGEYVGMRLTLY